MSLQLFASSPPGFPGVSLVRAAYYAGATGIAALEYTEADERRGVLESVVRSDVQFTVSVSALDAEMRALLGGAIGRGLEGVVISDALGPRLREDVDWIVGGGLRAYVEVTSLAQANAARHAGATHLIV